MDRLRASSAALLVALVLAACSAPGESGSSSASVEPVPSASEAPASEAPASVAPSGSAEPEAEATTLRTLIAAEPKSPTLTVEEELPGGDGYASAVVSYESDGLTIYGVLRTPEGDGPFPGIVFIHGAVNPATWSAQRDYLEWQERMVLAGYLVLVPDLRNHGESDDDPDWEFDVEMGTTLDVINAARALATEPAVDPERISVVGHSLGGAITLNALVVASDIAAAFVALAPANASPWDNLSHFASADDLRAWTDLHGTIDENPEFWADVSSLTFVDRADSPLLVVQGTADDVVPPEWAEVVGAAWTDAGKDVEVVMIDGGDHIFAPVEDEAWAAVLTFLEEQLP